MKRSTAWFARLAGLAAALFFAAFLVASDAGLTPLLKAAKDHDAAVIARLLEAGTDATVAGPDGTTALHWISYHDDVATAKRLVASGADVNAVTDLGVTPLWLAGQNGSAEMVRTLLAAGADPNRALPSGETPLMVAARAGAADAVEQMIEHGGDVNVHGARGQTALMWAAAQSHPDVVRVLIEHGADIRARSDVWTLVMGLPPHSYRPYNKDVPHGDNTALMFAAQVGDLKSAKILVDAGADVNDADAWGVSATTMAAHSGFTEFVEFLLDHGADPNAAKAGFAAIHEAVMRRDTRMARALLEAGAEADNRLETWTPTRRSSNDWNFDQALVGVTPYWLAARFDDPAMMRLLVEHGADPLFIHHADYVAEVGFGQDPRTETVTTLMAAVGLGRAGRAWVQPDRDQQEALTLEAVQLAVEAGVDVNAVGEDGRTALDGANRLGYESVIAYFTEHGAIAGKPDEGRFGRGGGRGRGGR